MMHATFMLCETVIGQKLKVLCCTTKISVSGMFLANFFHMLSFLTSDAKAEPRDLPRDTATSPYRGPPEHPFWLLLVCLVAFKSIRPHTNRFQSSRRLSAEKITGWV